MEWPELEVPPMDREEFEALRFALSMTYGRGMNNPIPYSKLAPAIGMRVETLRANLKRSRVHPAAAQLLRLYVKYGRVL